MSRSNKSFREKGGRPPARKPLPFETRSAREAGVLLHATSLPGPYGIGDLGPAAHAWVDQLAAAGQSWWQVLPLGPTAEERSPYQCLSAFAGNTLLISPDALLADGLLDRGDLRPVGGRPDRVPFAAVEREKDRLLHAAWETHRRGGPASVRRAYVAFVAKSAGGWLEDHALFMALRTANRERTWTEWGRPLVRREPAALDAARRQLAERIEYERFVQFLFFRQLDALRDHARLRGVGLLGDLPIFISAESSDVWVNPHLFQLDRHHRPTAVAGVPPDAFSADGQRWGNPLYDWEAMAADGYGWWIKRFRAAFDHSDAVRLDHFRGFDAYWRIPAAAPTAVHGRWVDGPGEKLFAAAEKALGRLPLVAEDLGVITERTVALREALGFPGMRILQFALGDDPRSPHLPHEYVRNSVAYPGTHDNDTAVGWFKTLPASRECQWLTYAGESGRTEPARTAIRLVWASTAGLAVVAMQDVLDLPTSARMNTPGTATGNWQWRLSDPRATEHSLNRLRQITTVCGRMAESDKNRDVVHGQR